MKKSEGNLTKTWQLFWAPEGRQIATVQARTQQSAVRKAPKPYSRYRGEIYAVKVTDNDLDAFDAGVKVGQQLYRDSH